MVKQLENTICKNLIRLRKSRRFSQRQIAAILSIKQSSYCHMECGYTQISGVRLGLLADFYNIPIQQFFQHEISQTDSSMTGERYVQLEEQLQKCEALLHIYEVRIGELEIKVGVSV